MTTLQEYANAQLDKAQLPQFKQKLKTLPAAFAELGWGHPRKPTDENKGVVVHTVGPIAIEFYEPATGKFAMDVTGPFVDNGLVPADVDNAERIINDEGGIADRSFITGHRAVNAQIEIDDPVKAALQPETAIDKFKALAEAEMQKGLEALMSAVIGADPDALDADAYAGRVLH